jgi:hypothetical protein
MVQAASRSAYTFHIPVMGTGFTIDSALRVAKYGISTVASLVDDGLIEQMRKCHCEKADEPYVEITEDDPDYRARRITEYLNLLDRLVLYQVRELQASPFDSDSPITRYFEMLPESALKRAYRDMLACEDAEQRHALQEILRQGAVPGSIDVNIMSKVDFDVYRNGQKLPPEYAGAMSALRGYANSTLRSSVVFSAGLNPRLYGYLGEYSDFFPEADGQFKKKITLKVSDYRSAVIQGKYFAKRGLWISEYRIESGLNCGGHAFATQGLLLGPILNEFRENISHLTHKLHGLYQKGLASKGRSEPDSLPEVRVTVQGGIGTAEENRFLMEHFGVDGTGWATPFLLVPEVTNTDPSMLQKLSEATAEDVYLSDSSPLGISFWNLRNSASEENRQELIELGTPGSICTKKQVRYNTEFTKAPLCIASRSYQRLKLQELDQEDRPEEQKIALRELVLARACICHDLAGGATLRNEIDPLATSAVCPGPSIADFSKIVTLREMVDHICGRISLITSTNRPHMFIRELMLYVDHLREEIKKLSLGISPQSRTYFQDFKENLLEGVEYYRQMASELVEKQQGRFLEQLAELRELIEPMLTEAAERGAEALEGKAAAV